MTDGIHPTADRSLLAVQLVLPSFKLLQPVFKLVLPSFKLLQPTFKLVLPTFSLHQPASKLVQPASKLLLSTFRFRLSRFPALVPVVGGSQRHSKTSDPTIGLFNLGSDAPL